MKAELIQSLTSTFEGHAQQTEGGIEYWLAYHFVDVKKMANCNTGCRRQEMLNGARQATATAFLYTSLSTCIENRTFL